MPDVALAPAAERWSGIFAPAWLRALADAVAVEVARNVAAAHYVYAEADASLLPFYAYDLSSLNWTDILGEEQQRRSLEVTRQINRLAGTPESWFVFCRSLDATGSIQYTEGGSPARAVSVDLFISPPLGFDAGAAFLSHVGRVARGTLVPYTLTLNAVHLLQRYTAGLYWPAAVATFRVGRVYDGGTITYP